MPPSLPSSLASSAVWSMGPGQVAKHVQPSLPPPPPPPPPSSPLFLSHPDGLLFSCAALRRFQPGQMFNTGDNMFAPHRCLQARNGPNAERRAVPLRGFGSWQVSRRRPRQNLRDEISLAKPKLMKSCSLNIHSLQVFIDSQSGRICDETRLLYLFRFKFTIFMI